MIKENPRLTHNCILIVLFLFYLWISMLCCSGQEDLMAAETENQAVD